MHWISVLFFSQKEKSFSLQLPASMHRKQPLNVPDAVVPTDTKVCDRPGHIHLHDEAQTLILNHGKGSLIPHELSTSVESLVSTTILTQIQTSKPGSFLLMLIIARIESLVQSHFGLQALFSVRTCKLVRGDSVAKSVLCSWRNSFSERFSICRFGISATAGGTRVKEFLLRSSTSKPFSLLATEKGNSSSPATLKFRVSRNGSAGVVRGRTLTTERPLPPTIVRLVKCGDATVSGSSSCELWPVCASRVRLCSSGRSSTFALA